MCAYFSDFGDREREGARYYLLGQEFVSRATCFMSVDYPDDVNVADFLRGSILEDGRVEGVEIRLEIGRRDPLLLANMEGLLLLKDVVVSELGLQKSDIAQCWRIGRGVAADYFLVNLLSVIDCLDLERSDLDRDEDGEIDRIHHYVLNLGSLIGGASIFRVRGYEAAVIVDENVAELVAREGDSSVFLTEVSVAPL